MKNISLLIIENDKAECESLKKIIGALNGSTVLMEAVDVESGYQKIKRMKPPIVILGLPEDLEKGLLMIEKIVQDFPETSVLVKSKDKRPETIIKALRAGAKDFFLTSSAHNGEICYAIKKIIKQRDDYVGSGPKIITIFSGKGGVGTTMIAANLGINLIKATSKSVVLVDLDLQFGNINMYLDVKSFSTLSDMVSNFERLDQALLQGSLAKHSSGICVLSAPRELEDDKLITPEKTADILNLLKDYFNYVIIDMPHRFEEYNLPAFDLADSIMLVSSPLLASINNTQRCLHTFKRLGYGGEKVKLIINRFIKTPTITPKDIEGILECPIFWTIPNDFATVSTSIDRGEPISVVAPRSEINKNLVRLARNLDGGCDTVVKKRSRGLFGLTTKKE